MNRTANTVLLVLGLLSSPPYCKGQCPCGPDYCPGDSRISRRLEEKKQALRRLSFPPDLIALLDRQSGCYAAVDRGPDGFSILTVRGSTKRTEAWTLELEERARASLQAGTMDRYYKFQVRRALACCNEPAFDQRADYDSEDDVNKRLAYRCQLRQGSVRCELAP
jgi:hypothetical protein